MNDKEIGEMKKVMKEVFPPAGDAELRRDLWPAMQARLERSATRVPWWDWVLLAGASLAILFFPGIIPALLYHL